MTVNIFAYSCPHICRFIPLSLNRQGRAPDQFSKSLIDFEKSVPPQSRAFFTFGAVAGDPKKIKGIKPQGKALDPFFKILNFEKSVTQQSCGVLTVVGVAKNAFASKHFRSWNKTFWSGQIALACKNFCS